MKRLITILLFAVSISAFSTSVTFKVSMKGSGMAYDSVFVVGEQTNWEFVQMLEEGDSVYSTTMNLTEGDSAAYYFITIGYWASDYLDYREIVPAECDYSVELAGWDGDRGFIVPAATTTISYIWGTCEEIPAASGLKENEGFENVDLFPNPSSGIINISIPGLISTSSIDIMDLTGKSLKTFETDQNNVSLDLSYLSTGLYFVKISEGQNTTIKKLIIK